MHVWVTSSVAMKQMAQCEVSTPHSSHQSQTRGIIRGVGRHSMSLWQRLQHVLIMKSHHIEWQIIEGPGPEGPG